EGNQIRTKKSCAKYRVGFKNPMKEARHGISTCKKLLKWFGEGEKYVKASSLSNGQQDCSMLKKVCNFDKSQSLSV
ncbi:hypothetical protein S83_015828, partial [Arachis hypogaea]